MISSGMNNINNITDGQREWEDGFLAAGIRVWHHVIKGMFWT